MHVHLITIEISVVGGRHRQVETEGGVGHDANAVPHHRHFVERWLAIENDKVAVLEMTFDLVSELEMSVTRLLHKTKIETLPVITDDILGSWVLCWSVANEFLHSISGVRLR